MFTKDQEKTCSVESIIKMKEVLTDENERECNSAEMERLPSKEKIFFGGSEELK